MNKYVAFQKKEPVMIETLHNNLYGKKITPPVVPLRGRSNQFDTIFNIIKKWESPGRQGIPKLVATKESNDSNPSLGYGGEYYMSDEIGRVHAGDKITAANAERLAYNRLLKNIGQAERYFKRNKVEPSEENILTVANRYYLMKNAPQFTKGVAEISKGNILGSIREDFEMKTKGHTFRNYNITKALYPKLSTQINSIFKDTIIGKYGQQTFDKYIAKDTILNSLYKDK